MSGALNGFMDGRVWAICREGSRRESLTGIEAFDLFKLFVQNIQIPTLDRMALTFLLNERT